MRLELLLRIAEEGALVAGALVVHFQHMRGQAFRARRLIIAQQANKRFCVRIQMTFQAPLIRAGPRTVTAGEAFLTLRFEVATSGARIANNATIGAAHTDSDVILFLLFELWQGRVGRCSYSLDGLRNAHARRGRLALRFQECIVQLYVRTLEYDVGFLLG